MRRTAQVFAAYGRTSFRGDPGTRAALRGGWIMRAPFLFALLVVALGVFRGAHAADQTSWEHWFVLDIAGQPAGYMHETFTEGSEGAVLRTDLVMRIGRGDSSVRVEQSSVFMQDAAGRPRELRTMQNMGVEAVDQRWIFEDDHVRHSSRQGERTLERRLDLPKDPGLTPVAAQRFIRQRLDDGASRIRYRVLLPETGLDPEEVRLHRLGEEQIDVLGQMRVVSVWEQISGSMPDVATKVFLSADGHAVRTEVDVPFGRMVTRLATREEALATAGAAAPQILVETFVHPDRRIASPRRLRRAVFRLDAMDGVLPEIPTAGAQRVRMESPRTAIVTIDLDAPVPADDADIGNRAYLDSTAMIDAGDPLITELAERAIGSGEASVAKRAELMRRFVARYVHDKDLDTAFATASETARTRRGDCSEHAVLLAAMLRAQSIPARIAVGLIYADAFAGSEHIFGWHMWTQALMDGVWVDLDATLDVPSDATHILTGVAALDDPVPAGAFVQLLRLIGNLEITVLEGGLPEGDAP